MLANFTLKRKLEEATSAHDDITPVYLLDEVWNFVNSPSTDINAMVEFINKRVAHKSPLVKAKALRLIKFICTKGASDFKRGLSKSAGTVRELVHYRGEPDPFKGDALNQKVREAAKEALDAVFAPVDTMHTNTHQPAYAARIQGFGSGAGGGAASSSASAGPSAASTTSNANWGAPSTNSSGGGGLGSGGSKMVGFGNPRFEAQKGMQGGSKSAAQTIMSSKSWATAATAAANAASNLASKGQAALNMNRVGSLIKDEEKTGYSSGEEGSYRGPAALPGGAPVGTHQSSLNPSTPTAAANVYTSGTAPVSSEGEEDRLVESICTPGGLRAQPDRADLQTFVESLGSLNGDKLVELLTHKMDAGPWQATLRAICALEAVIQLGHTEVCGRIAVAFQSEPSALQKAAASPLASLRQHATKVLKLLGLEGTVGNASAAAAGTTARRAQPVAAPAHVPDLMGGFDDEPATAAAPTASAAPDMLGDLMGPDASASTSAAATPHAQAPAAQGVTSSAPVDLMGGFGLPAAAAPSNGFTASQAQPDLFGGMSVAGHQQPPPLSPAAALANGNAAAHPAASAAADSLAGLFTGLSTDAHGSEAGIPNMAMKSSGRVGSMHSLQGSGSGGMGQAMGAGPRGGSPAPPPLSMPPGAHNGMFAMPHQQTAPQPNGPLGMSMGLGHTGMSGYGSEAPGAIPLDAFSGPSAGMRANSGTPSLGVASSKDFDFVGEHLSTLKRK
ncbi:hypothetical protein WJX73_004195 [Symbiochloris irregularis]|uniref:ENTH domain-containing protein n=1 Tax=Symbiochloris irregularis TaxID=706552 RepID=A0AAW1PQM8_9CHLO